MLELKKTLIFSIHEWNQLSILERHVLEAAIEARQSARCKVSGFAVGAAISTIGGSLYKGCNIEDYSHRGTIHAEEAALAAFVTNATAHDEIVCLGLACDFKNRVISIPPERGSHEITSLADIKSTVCGHCRTLLDQYRTVPIQVVALQLNGQILVTTLDDLYPLGFALQ